MATATSTRRRGLTGTAGNKTPCIAGSTANLTLSAEQTVDGIALVADDRVLCKDQTDGIENGIYVVATGAWQRAVDWDGAGDVVEGTMVRVNRGTTNSDTYWRISTTGTITIGTTDVTMVQGLTDVAIAATTTVTDESTDTTCFPVFMTAATGNNAVKSDAYLTYNSNTGNLGSELSNVTGTTDATSATAGARTNAGGEAIAKTLWVGQDIVLDERADHAATSAAGNGIFWLKDDTPNHPKFTDDAATDHYVLLANAALKTKVVDIGDWDMSTATGTTAKAVAHGLTLADIRSISVTIRADGASFYRDFAATNNSGTGDHDIDIGATNVTLTREASGLFDSTNYNSTSFNRGWITIQYV